jgi:DNA-binding CsgD family transcriptional regulator
MLETRPQPQYQVIAERALQLRQLGMSDLAIARALGINDKTVAKSIRWVLIGT